MIAQPAPQAAQLALASGRQLRNPGVLQTAGELQQTLSQQVEHRQQVTSAMPALIFNLDFFAGVFYVRWGSQYVAEVGLELAILKSWDCWDLQVFRILNS